jgi:PAS domain S-box-containing protein
VREDGTPFPGMEHPAMVTLRTGQPVRGVVMGVWNPQRNERRWIEIETVPVFEPDQKHPTEVYAVFADITERKGAEEQVARDLDAMTRLQKLGTLFVQDGNLEPVLAEVVDAAVAIALADFGNIQLLDPATGDLRIVAHRGFPPWWLDFWNSVSKGKGSCGTALERGERVMVQDIEQSPIFVGTAALDIQRRAGVRAVQSTPLVSRSGKPLGMFSTHYKIPDRLDERALRVLDLLARQAADMIDRAQAEVALRESERRERERAAELAALLDAAPAAVFIAHDPECRHITGNQAANELLRGSPGGEASLSAPANVRPQHFKAVKDGRELPVDELPAQRAARGEKIQDFEFSLVFNDGAVRNVVGNGAPLLDERGKPRGSMLVLTDITAGRRIEAALRESEAQAKVSKAVRVERQRLQEVLDMLPAYVVLLTPDYRVPVANRFFEERFGKAGGRRCYEHLFHRTAPCENCRSYKVFETDEVQRWEWAGPDGRDYDIHDFPFTDADGSKLVLEVGLDITERKRAEDAVRRANAYNRSLVEANLDPLVTIGPDGKITDVNAATEAATGYERGVLIGTDFSTYFREPEKARAGYLEAFRAGSVRNCPLELRHRDGQATSVLYSASVYRDEAGKVAGVFAAARDITERKRAEQEQQVLREDLARISRITTAGQLAASLAHELNQPLGAIVCNIQAVQNYLTQGGADQPEVREALTDIEADGKRAGAVIHQLRRLYQKTGQRKAPVLLNDILERTLDLYHGEFVLREVELEVEFEAALPAVPGNEVELQQVVLNLVTNAVEAMAGSEPGARQIRIRTANAGPDEIRVSVQDSGPGLRKEQLERLFEPFYTTKATGMGMGLAISQSIVEAHKGRLWAENNPNRGATFHFTLPTTGEASA